MLIIYYCCCCENIQTDCVMCLKHIAGPKNEASANS